MDDHANGPDGRAAWIAAAVERYEQPLARYAERFLGDADRARDVVQDTFLRLCRQERADLNGRLGEWLYTVCRNRAVDVRRKERPVRDLTRDVAQPREDAPVAAGSATDVSQALAGLSANQQEAIRLKFHHGLKYREIAAVTGLSVSNVGFLIHTGLKKMRAALGETP
jgi:RNA polymerase sigma-70 factor (ECF subfamily)